jgi:Protein of unknown function (DUF664)
VTKPRHRADYFLDPEVDPREGGPRLGDERATLTEFLRRQRLTLQLKCDGLDPIQLVDRAVEPSTMSLLGLMRQMAEVERIWFRRRFAGFDVPKLCQSDEEPDGDFDGAVADQEVVNDAWAAWRAVAFAEQFASKTNLSFVGRDGASRPISLRELLVSHDRGVRPAQRPRRSTAGAHRRSGRSLDAGCVPSSSLPHG